jgi:hypothetical protein
MPDASTNSNAHLPDAVSAPSVSLAERFPWVILWVGLFVRLAFMTFAHTWHVRAHWDHFEFGYEMGRIARSLVEGYGYASPFWGHTGPTAWEPPLYPWLLAAVFKVCGVYTPLAAWVTLAINCVLGAFTLPAVWRISVRAFNRKVAVWATWIWAIYPAAMQYDVKWIWEMTLTCFLFTWVFALALKMRGVGEAGSDPATHATPGRWALFAVLWALIALSNPSLQLFLPACGLWILWGSPQWKKQLVYGVMAALIFIACLAPWTYRNFQVFHHFVPLRSDFGFELFNGNGPGSTGMIREYDQPFESPNQLKLYKEMGELAYVRWHGEVAKRFIAEHPLRFWKLTGERIFMYWAGVPEPIGGSWSSNAIRGINFALASLAGLFGLALAMRRRVPARWVFFWAFALLPLTYYFITVHARFRHPMEPLIDVLGVYLFQAAEKSWKIRWFRRHA